MVKHEKQKLNQLSNLKTIPLQYPWATQYSKDNSYERI